MQKQNRSIRSDSSVQYARPRFPVPLPEIINIDVLSTMLDEDLMVRMRQLEEDRYKVTDLGMDAKPWEEEVAYLRREQQVRRSRRDAHSDYVRKSESEFNRAEWGLPAGDFDNSAFVYAATGGRQRWS